MSNENPICLTCLSFAVNGVVIPPTTAEFLQNAFHFKFAKREDFPDVLCLPCYNILSEMQNFYAQLQDVENYYNRKICIGPKRMQENVFRRMTQTKKPKQITSDELHETMKSEPERPAYIKCVKCPQIFKSAKHYKRHLRSHEKNFECQTCTKTFRSFAEKQAHERIHNYPGPYECEICHRVYHQLSALTSHQAVHFGKRLRCIECCKRFLTKAELVRHLNLHKKQRKYHQHILDRQERQSYQQAHTNQFNCLLCNKTYYDEETLEAHTKIIHYLENNKAAVPNGPQKSVDGTLN